LTFGRTIAVIELKRDDVGLAAVNTRMRTQVRTEKAPVLCPAPANSVDLPSDVVVSVP
jgi:hypothetical protein